MTDLARQSAELIADGWDVDVAEVAEIIERHGTLVSHEDAAWLKLARCPDPLTLDAAVKVMGREPDEDASDKNWFMWDEVQVWRTGGGIRCIVENETVYNPTIGQFACLVAAARMGEKA